MNEIIQKQVIGGGLFVHLHETDSTNRFLHDYEDKEHHKMTVVYADYQTAGRGQGQNHWESEQGKNLTFSLLIHPTCVTANRQFVISMAISMAIKNCLGNYLGEVSIKWPNDIYYKHSKICGILIENNLSGHCINDSVLGIGININQREFKSDAPNPISMWNILGKDTDREDVLRNVVTGFTDVMDMVEQGRIDEVRQNYLASLYRKDGYHAYADGQGAFSALLKTVEDDGHLILVDDNNKTRKYAFKEVKFII